MTLAQALRSKRRKGWPCHTVLSAKELWKHLANAAMQFTGRELGLGNEVVIQVRELENKVMIVKLSVKKEENESNIGRSTIIPFRNYSHGSMVNLMREVMHLAKEDDAEVSEEKGKWEFIIPLD